MLTQDDEGYLLSGKRLFFEKIKKSSKIAYKETAMKNSCKFYLGFIGIISTISISQAESSRNLVIYYPYSADTPATLSISPTSIFLPQNTGTTTSAEVHDSDWYYYISGGVTHYVFISNALGTLSVPSAPFTNVTINGLTYSGDVTGRYATYSITAGNVPVNTVFSFDFEWQDSAPPAAKDSDKTETVWVTIT